MSIFYIADLHFGHKNVIDFDHRPFSNLESMDRTLIELWNRKVTDADHVYIIGDFACRNTKGEEWYLQQLHGHKHLIIGNHDMKLLNNAAALSCLESVDKMKHISDSGTQICLCHFPLAEWNGYYRGHTHIYGHIHNAKNEAAHFMRTKSHALNAGCMINGYAPVTLSELIANNYIWKMDGREETNKDKIELEEETENV